MSKIVVSPSKRWSGSVVIADPLRMSQAQAIEAALELPAEWAGLEPNARVFVSVRDTEQLDAIFACVEEWRIDNMPENLTPENFPASPRVASHKFIEWLFGEIVKVYVGEVEIPNA